MTMSRALITGGTGVLGRQLVPRLLERGHRVRIGSRGPRRETSPADVEWAQMDLAKDEHLTEALNGADTVIHAASNPVSARKVDIGGTHHLIRAAEQAGVGHLLYISIVGIDEFPLGYYRAKRDCEKLIAGGQVPYTILRATQFHELLDQRFLPALFKVPFVAPVPTDFQFQLIDSGEVAEQMVQLVAAGPSGRVRDIGGPEVLTMGALSSEWRRAYRVKKNVVHLRVPGGAAEAFRRGKNTCPEERHGTITWERYLALRDSA